MNAIKTGMNKTRLRTDRGRKKKEKKSPLTFFFWGIIVTICECSSLL